jgi:hypothetical protein
MLRDKSKWNAWKAILLLPVVSDGDSRHLEVQRLLKAAYRVGRLAIEAALARSVDGKRCSRALRQRLHRLHTKNSFERKRKTSRTWFGKPAIQAAAI